MTEEDILEEIPYIEEDPLFLDEIFKTLQENDIEVLEAEEQIEEETEEDLTLRKR